MSEQLQGPADTLETAYSVLRHAVTQTTRPGHVPRASQVRLAMKHLTYDGFDPVALGFKRFRDFLRHAEEAGHVVIREKTGDVEVLLSGASADPVETKMRVRRDIWRSFVDWDPDTLHYLDLENGKAIQIPKQPVDLEPARFSDLRERVAKGDTQLVKIPSVPVGEQIRWMRQFAEEVSDEALQTLLMGALAGEKPAKNFTSIVRADSSEQRRWNLFYGARVLSAVRAWTDADQRLSGVEVFDEEEVTATDEQVTPDDPDRQASTKRLIDAASRLVAPSLDHSHHRSYLPRSAKVGSSTPQDQLRLLAHRAIDRMSEAELRVLQLPLGRLVDEG